MKSLLTFLAFCSLLNAEDYRLIEPDPKVYTDLQQTFTIVADHAVEIGEIKPHPKIVWLDGFSQRTNDAVVETRLNFVVRAPGLIKFPPIPVVIESKSFFLRLKDIQAIKNPSSKELGNLQILWNGETTPPEKIHLGEALEVDLLAKVPTDSRARPFISPVPIARANNADWYLFTRSRGRNATPKDYFYDFRQNSSSRRYQSRVTTIDDQPVITRRYRARLICSELGEVSGKLGITLGQTLGRSDYLRTYLVPFKFTVLPLPSLPNERLVNTGLVGNWSIEPRISPSVLSTNTPLEITLDISGQGNPNLRREFDLSREGFASVDSKLIDPNGMNYEIWQARFIQTLVPSGNVASFPAVTMTSFDTKTDQWKLHPITPSMTLPGEVDLSKNLPLAESAKRSIKLPILLNLPSLTFPLIALAPFLPFLLRLLKKRIDQRDPRREKRQKKARQLIGSLQSGAGNAEQIDSELLPILREHLALPAGASTSEIADTLSPKNAALSGLLRDHAKASFSSSTPPIDLKTLATQLAKISFLFLLIGNLRASSLENANQAYSQGRFSDAISQYESLTKEHPGSIAAYQNLAVAYLAVDDPGRARAACHTALLLSPLDPDLRTLMDSIRQRVGEPSLPGTRLLALRPDQYFFLAALLWLTAFLLLGLRHFPRVKVPRWVVYPLFAFSLIALASGAWRYRHAYAQDQYMIIGDEVPREPQAGTPDWEYPTLKNGHIVNISETIPTHARIDSGDTSFWIPLNELKQVW